MKRISTIILFIILALSISTGAQSRQPFSDLRFSFGIGQNINKVLLHQFWEPGKSFNLEVETPFYLGNIESGLSRTSFAGDLYIYPDFNSYFLFAGWNLDKQVFEFIKFNYGIRSGVFVMQFDDKEASEYQSTESELGISLTSEVGIKIYKELYLNIYSEFLTVFTEERIKLFNIGAGLSYQIETPAWLRNFFE